MPPASPSTTWDAASLLLGRGAHIHRDSRRIAAGLVVLAALAVVVLNVGIYQSAQSHLVRQRWDQLIINTEVRRDQVQSLIERLTSEARSVVEQPQTRAALLALPDGIPVAECARLRRELERTRTLFGFNAVRVFDVRGRSLLGGPATQPHEDERYAGLAQQAAAATESMVMEAWCESGGSEALALAFRCAPRTTVWQLSSRSNSTRRMRSCRSSLAGRDSVAPREPTSCASRTRGSST